LRSGISIAIAAALAVLPASALAAKSAEEWTWTPEQQTDIAALTARVAKENGFFVVSRGDWLVKTEISPRVTAETLVFMERVARTFDRVVPVKAKPKVTRRATVVIFDDKAKYARIEPNGSGGCFLYDFKNLGRWTRFHIYTYLAKSRRRRFGGYLLNVLMHEGAHLLLRRRVGKAYVPPWFEEGLATCFERVDLRSAKGAGFGSRDRESGRLLRAAPGSWSTRYPDLRRLASLGQGKNKWNPDKMGPMARYHYAVCENFMEFMLTTATGKETFAKIFRRVLKRQRSLLSKIECQVLEPQWHRYLRKSLSKSKRPGP